MSLENAKEHTALDVAMLWGDPRVANLLMDKFEKMGLLGDKDDKKGKGKKDKKGAKKGISAIYFCKKSCKNTIFGLFFVKICLLLIFFLQIMVLWGASWGTREPYIS